MKRALILFAALVVIVAGSVVPFRGLNRLFWAYPGLDKILHAGAWFLVTVFLYTLGSEVVKVFHTRARLLMVTISILTFSLILESAQGLVGGRSFEVGDVLANLAGIVLGAVIMERRNTRVLWMILAAMLSISTVAALVAETRDDYGHYMKGLSYQHEKKYELAKEQFLLALERDVRTAQLYNDLAWLNLELLNEDLDASLSYARNAVTMNPQNPDFIDTYGWALYRLGRNEEALANLLKAYDLDPTIYCIHYHLGLAYLNAGNMEKALFHLQKQKEQTPGDLYDRLSDERIASIESGQGLKEGGR